MKLKKLHELTEIRNKRIDKIVRSNVKRLNRFSFFLWEGVLR